MKYFNKLKKISPVWIIATCLMTLGILYWIAVDNFNFIYAAKSYPTIHMIIDTVPFASGVILSLLRITSLLDNKKVLFPNS